MYHLITQLFCVGATIWNFSIFCISMVLSGFCCPNSLPLWIHMMKHQHCTAHFTFSCMNKPFLVVFRSLSQYTCFVIFCSSILLPWYCLFLAGSFWFGIAFKTSPQSNIAACQAFCLIHQISGGKYIPPSLRMQRFLNINIYSVEGDVRAQEAPEQSIFQQV